MRGKERFLGAKAGKYGRVSGVWKRDSEKRLRPNLGRMCYKSTSLGKSLQNLHIIIVDTDT